MTAGSDGDEPNDIVSSLLLTEETTASKKQQLSISTETLKSLPTLPFELIEEEILSRLPVKLLLQLRCICKSWNSLISDPKFAKKHLRSSTKRHHLTVGSTNNLDEFVFLDFPISSIFSTFRAPKLTELGYPITPTNDTYRCPRYLSSCDGILCFAISDTSAVLWNPSIRKLKILPPFESPRKRASQNEVSTLTLGADYWRRIQDFPYSGHILGPGIFVSGTVNWLVYEPSSSYSRALVSLDLEKELFQKLPQPDLEYCLCTFGVLKDCLSIFASSKEFLDVWIMKEYGNKESWTKLYTVHYLRDLGFRAYTHTLYVSEDYQMLMYYFELRSNELKFVVYDSKNDSLNISEIPNTYRWKDRYVYIESLISPDSLS